MIVSFPSPPSNYASNAMTQILDTIRRAFVSVVSSNEAAPRILLQSPNGTVYQITVSDTGALTTAVQSGKTRI